MIKFRHYISLVILLAFTKANSQVLPPGFTRYDKSSTGIVWPNNFWTHSDILYFEGLTSSYGMEVCKFDDANPPATAKDLYPGTGWGNFHPITSYNDTIYFWGTNGSTEGIYAYDVANYNISCIIADTIKNINSYSFAAYSDRFYFSDNNNITGISCVFEYNITTKTLDTIFYHPYYSTINYIHGFNNKIYISTFTHRVSFVNDLLVYNADTKQVDTLLTDLYLPVVEAFAELNGKVYFAATDPNYGYELFEHDGVNKPQRVTDYNTGRSNTVYNTFPVIISFNNRIYFAGFDGIDKALYEYNPLNATTKIIYTHSGQANNMPKGFAPWAAHVYHNKLFMYGVDPQKGCGLFVYTGRNQPYMIAELCDNYHSIRAYFIEFKNDLFFAARDSTGSSVLHRYNDSLLTVPGISASNVSTITTYPNPVNDIFVIDGLTAETRIELYDIVGRNVYQGVSKSEKENINISHLPTGNYIIQLTDPHGQRMTGKIMKQ